MNHTIRIKIGSIEIEYEGTEDYLKNDLPSLIDKIVNLKANLTNHDDENSDESPPSSGNGQHKSESSNLKMSINSISAKLEVKSGPDLIIAACAHLALVQQKETCKRKEILQEMKRASNYYKNSYNANLSAGLKRLVSTSKLIERQNDTYALSADTLSRLKSTLNA